MARTHLPRAGPARRRRRVLAHRRRRRARRPDRHLRQQLAVVVDCRPGHHGGRRHLGPDLRDEHRPSGRAHHPRRRRHGGVRRRARAVRAPRGGAWRGRPGLPDHLVRRSRHAESPRLVPDVGPARAPGVARARRTRRRRAPRRCGDDHLHVGHDRRPEGRRPVVREPRRPVRGDQPRLLGDRARPVAVLPAAQPRLRARLDVLHPQQGGAELLPRRSQAHSRGDAGGAADVHGQRAAPLREDLLDGAPQGEPGVGDQAEAVRVGGEGRQPVRPREGARRAGGPGARGAARPGRQAGAAQDPRHRGRPEELLLGRAAPR